MERSELDVLVLAKEDDAHAQVVINYLRNLDARVGRLSAGDLQRGETEIRPLEGLLRIDRTTYDLSERSTVWYYRPAPVLDGDLAPDEAQLLVEESTAALLGAVAVAGARWVDHPAAVAHAELKLLQLHEASRLGILVPETVVTTVPHVGAAFLRGRRAVAKALSSGTGIAPYVDEVYAGEMDLARVGPVMIQELIAATADLRIVVISGDAFVWRRPRAEGELDWRATDADGGAFEAVSLPKLAIDAVRLTYTLNLSMSTQDWLELPDGSYRFLEANPQGSWLFLRGADTLVVPSLAAHLLASDQPSAGHWPTTLRRFTLDMRTAACAPDNDGAVAPHFPTPLWIASAAVHPQALEVTRSARKDAEDGAWKAEEKAARLLQVSLALLTIAIGLGAYQMTFCLARHNWWLLALIPIALAVVFLALSGIEASQIDRVGFYGALSAAPLAARGASEVATEILGQEELGRALAAWSGQKKISDLMQARAWFSRGLLALIAAALLAATCRAIG